MALTPTLTLSLTPSRIPTETLTKAITSLLKWLNSSKSQSTKLQLLPSEDFIYLILTLKKIPTNSRTNPFKIPLSHPVYPYTSLDNPVSCCLIIDDRPAKRGDAVKDDSVETLRLTKGEVKKKVEEDGVCVHKVIKLSKLKSDYKAYEQKRKLCGSYDMFFADNRVIPLLPRLLGKEFFKRKKIPVPVNLMHKNWKEQVEGILGSALLFLRSGTCSVVKIGRSSMSEEELVENLVRVIDGVVGIVPKGWEGIRSLHLKSNESVALPVYTSVPEIGLKIESAKVEGKGVMVVHEGVKGKGKKKSVEKRVKRGRIHEVDYLNNGDDVLGEALGDMSSDLDEVVMSEEEEKSPDLGEAELSGKKRKNVVYEKSVKKKMKMLAEKVVSGESEKKKIKKPAEKVISGESEKKKLKKSPEKIVSLESGKKKMKKPVEKVVSEESEKKKIKRSPVIDDLPCGNHLIKKKKDETKSVEKIVSSEVKKNKTGAKESKGKRGRPV